MSRYGKFMLVLILALASDLVAQSQPPVVLASLRPNARLVLQRVYPAGNGDNNALEGPVLYQLLLNASGTPGTVPVFDTNPRHLTNSPIVVGASNVAIGGLSIDSSSGIISFAGRSVLSRNGNCDEHRHGNRTCRWTHRGQRHH
jgi:hypothetical protein